MTFGSKEEFEQSHIPNALNISLQSLKDHISQLDKNFQFITACGNGGGRSAEGAKLLNELGFNAIWLCGGTNKWINTRWNKTNCNSFNQQKSCFRSFYCHNHS